MKIAGASGRGCVTKVPTSYYLLPNRLAVVFTSLITRVQLKTTINRRWVELGLKIAPPVAANVYHGEDVWRLDSYIIDERLIRLSVLIIAEKEVNESIEIRASFGIRQTKWKTYRRGHIKRR